MNSSLYSKGVGILHGYVGLVQEPKVSCLVKRPKPGPTWSTTSFLGGATM